jgi:transposase
MKAYSQDLREKIIESLEGRDVSQAETADNFGVSLSFVEKLWRRWRQTGSGAALPRGGGRPRALKEEAAGIRAAIAKQPDATLDELCQYVAQAGGATASASMMCRELKRLKLPRKKSRFTTVSATRHG